MARLSVCVSGGYIAADVQTSGAVLEEALHHDKADVVVRCALLMALSALAEGDPWPKALLGSMACFMSRMENAVRSELDEANGCAAAGAVLVAPKSERQRRRGDSSDAGRTPRLRQL